MFLWGAVAAVVALLVLVWRALVGSRRPLRTETRPVDRRLRVAVVGGGIAGSGAAWAMRRAGMDVTLYEKKPQVGGNANSDSRRVRVGLSVLAWPKLFLHYDALLKELGIATQVVRLPFFVEEGKTICLDQTAAVPLHPELEGDFARWKRMLWVIRLAKRVLAGPSPSLYAFSFLNPFAAIRLRFLSRLFGVSDRFWTRIVVPIYSTTFLTSNLNHIPSVIAPVMDEIVPLGECPRLTTWSEGSEQVFEAMLRGVRVLAGESVARVQRDSSSIVVESESTDGSHRSESFDRVVMACDAPAALAMLGESVGRLTRFLLRRIVYVDDCEGADFLQGWIHRDESVLSAEGKKRVREMSNAVSVTRSGEVVNTFVLSSWIPKVLSLRLEESEKPFLVTYGKVPIADPIQQVSFRFAHPMLCFTNIVASFLLRFVHQPTQIAFCGSWTTPGNGHDLSLCSGLAAAHSLGAAYPFAGDKTLVEEFARVRSVVGQ